MSPRLRLLKVICQAVFVLDDGDTLVEQAAEPVSVPTTEWPDYAEGAFAQSVEKLRRQVEGPPRVQCPGCGAWTGEWCDTDCPTCDQVTGGDGRPVCVLRHPRPASS